MYSIKIRSIKAVFAGAAVALALPLSAFAGHDNFLRELARTDGDPSGAASHIEVSSNGITTAKPDMFITHQLAVTDGYTVPLDTANKASMASSGTHEAKTYVTDFELRRFADSNGGA